MKYKKRTHFHLVIVV